LDAHARDLIQNLLHLDPALRLGAPGRGGYDLLKLHPFFTGIDFATVHTVHLATFINPTNPDIHWPLTPTSLPGHYGPRNQTFALSPLYINLLALLTLVILRSRLHFPGPRALLPPPCGGEAAQGEGEHGHGQRDDVCPARSGIPAHTREYCFRVKGVSQGYHRGFDMGVTGVLWAAECTQRQISPCATLL
jgi:hypothetical protein